MVQNLGKDLRYALRGLRKAKGFTAVTVLTLALAIGPSVAIYTVVDAVLLDPLPYKDANDLVYVAASAPGTDLPEEFGVAEEFYFQYRDANVFEELAMFDGFTSTLSTADWAERVGMSETTASLFSLLGVNATLGRVFGPEDADDVFVMSHGYWQRQFGSDPSVIGRSMMVGGELRTLIGIAEPHLQIPDDDTVVWFPYDTPEAEVRPGQLGESLFGRPVAGMDREEVISRLTASAALIPDRFGVSPRYIEFLESHRPIVRSVKEEIVGDVITPLWVLLGTMAVVLLIACANVANLIMVRFESRRRELAVRQALGASRRRLTQGQLVEALVIAGLGGIGGALFAVLGVPLLIRAAPDELPRADAVQLDWSLPLVAAGFALVAAAIFGIVPALRSTRLSETGNSQLAGRNRLGGVAHHRLRNAIVVGQTALALVLLVGSGLLVRSFIALRSVDPGYATENIFSFQVAPPDVSREAMYAFHENLMERIRALPGVQTVGVVNNLPLDERTSLRRFERQGDAPDGNGVLLSSTFSAGDHFEALDIRLLEGRAWERADQEHDAEVSNLILSQSAVQQLWPGESGLGKRMRRLGDTTGWDMVVGVVEDVRQDNFREIGEATVYFPVAGEAGVIGSPAYVVKTPRAATIASEIRALAREVSPQAPFYRAYTMDALVQRSMTRLSFTMLTLGIASGLALILGAVGLYGVLSFIVNQRAQEIGLRMALGATARDVRTMVVRQGGVLALVGVAVGVVASIGVTRVLDTLLFGVAAIDILTLVAVSAVMIGVAGLACYLPARRASSVDPLRTLQSE